MIFHTMQGETSHFPALIYGDKRLYMDESETFRANLLRLMAEKGFKAAELSKRAKLNPRAVKDIEEHRVTSPKLSTVFALAKALGSDPAEMMGLGPRSRLARWPVRLWLHKASQKKSFHITSRLKRLSSPS